MLPEQSQSLEGPWCTFLIHHENWIYLFFKLEQFSLKLSVMIIWIRNVEPHGICEAS